jgi:hypothetical protein
MKKLREILLLWPGTWGLPIAFLLWVASPVLLRMVDPTSATLDAGVLQFMLYAAIAMLLFNELVFMGIKFNFPSVFDFYKTEFQNAFKGLETWQKVKVLCALYLGLLLALVLLLMAIIT